MAHHASTRGLNAVGRLLDDKLVAAVPVPHSRDGRFHEQAFTALTDWLSHQPVDGVAIWTPVGHGLTSPAPEREAVFAIARRQLRPGAIILCGAGCSNEDVSAPEVGIKLSADLAEDAARLGADAVLAYPPTFLRGMALHPCPGYAGSDVAPEEILADWVEEYHLALGSAGLPVVACFLTAAAGGFHYDAALRQRLLDLDVVQAANFSAPDSDTPLYDWNDAQAHSPGKLLIAGVDELLARSIVIGARAALSAVATAVPSLVRGMLSDFAAGNHQAFAARSARFNRAAELIWTEPYASVGRRLLLLLAESGIIPAEAAHDPWAPELPQEELAALRSLALEIAGQYSA